MKRKINKNFLFLRESVNNGKRGVVLEGSSRSGKTWGVIDFLVYYVARIETGLTINIIKETYNSFKTTLYEDFKRRLPDYGIPNPFSNNIKEIQSFNLLGTRVNLIGADKPSKYLGAGSDIVWINEAVHVPKEIFDQAEMRCRKYFIQDYNPSFEEHYIYDSVITRPDVGYLKTTYLDNPFISPQEKSKIISYNPQDPINVKNGTADDYMWQVYGLGLRASPKGLVFSNWKEYEHLPVELEYYRMFVVDWGGTDPTTLTELNINRKTKSVYIKEHIYQPQIGNTQFIDKLLELNKLNDEVICDSSRSDKIYELQMAGINALGAKKGAGSILDGLDIMKEYNIFVYHKSLNAKKEFNSYKWATEKSSGKPLNKPEDKNNHVIDPTRYGLRYYHLNYGI
jgi:PBSX family phage terminase large subunit